MRSSLTFTLSLLILALVPSVSAGEQRIMSHFDQRSDAVTRFHAALENYVAQRNRNVEPDAVGSFCLPDDSEEEGAWWTPYEGAFFFPEIARVIRRAAAEALRREDTYGDTLAKLTRETLRAPIIRVNEILPPKAGEAPAPWLAAVLPALPREVGYRQMGLDLVLIDADSGFVLDVLRSALLPD